MSALLASEPFGRRQETTLLKELNELTDHHIRGCPEYNRLFPRWRPAGSAEELPFLHVGLFKRLALKTQAPGIRHGRTLTSSSTSGAVPSQIPLDERSSSLQAASVLSIHRSWLGGPARPLLILDEAQALRQSGLVSARMAAALSLLPLASETHFILENAQRPDSIRWELVRKIVERHPWVLFYGPTWELWQAWADQKVPKKIASLLRRVKIDYVHSGGWKKLEAMKVGRQTYDARLQSVSSPASRVIDYYGLSEQIGLFFPLCDQGRRHAPLWAEVVVRDIYTLKPIIDRPGFLQFMNPLAWGAPYHSVLTEDLGRRSAGNCPCGFTGRHFELLGRVPRAELRGCANV